MAGRLDVNSTGLLVLTQSGVVAQQLVSPRAGVEPLEKEYLVRIPAPSDDDDDDLESRLDVLRGGIRHGGEILECVRVDRVHDDQLRLVLTEGKHHHIRRMLQAIDVPVRALKRVRIGNVVLGDLPLGQWRYLAPHERFGE